MSRTPRGRHARAVGMRANSGSARSRMHTSRHQRQDHRQHPCQHRKGTRGASWGERTAPGTTRGNICSAPCARRGTSGGRRGRVCAASGQTGSMTDVCSANGIALRRGVSNAPPPAARRRSLHDHCPAARADGRRRHQCRFDSSRRLRPCMDVCLTGPPSKANRHTWSTWATVKRLV